MRRAWALYLSVAVVFCACGPGAAPGPIPPAKTTAVVPPDAATSRSRTDLEIEVLADGLLAKARALEPSVSPRLRELAADANGQLVGFEHRFKTRESTIRKIRQRLAGKPGLPVREVVIDDALRYTIRVDDEPAGHYNRTGRDVLSALESDGHVVVRVKNYWPKGDNYSGVNSVLRGPSGLEWELQFHTSASLATQQEGRPLYEEMRLTATPAARKLELFQLLTAPWESVQIPAGVLDEQSLHEREKIIRRDPPR